MAKQKVSLKREEKLIDIWAASWPSQVPVYIRTGVGSGAEGEYFSIAQTEKVIVKLEKAVAEAKKVAKKEKKRLKKAAKKAGK